MFRRGNKCSQLNYLRSKTKLIKQNNNEAAVCLQARQRLPCNAKFIIKCGECCREREGGQLRWQLWSLLHCPGWKREQPKLKDVGVMFAMKEHCVVTTPHWAFHPSAGRSGPPQNDFTIWWSRFHIWKVCTDWSLLSWWSLATNYPNCPLGCDPGAVMSG